MDVTILELDLENAQFNAPFAGDVEEDAGDTDDEDEDEDEGAGASRPGFDARPLAAIAVLAGLVVLARYLRSDDDEGVEIEADELEIEES
jgi:hypothetical protein